MQRCLKYCSLSVYDSRACLSGLKTLSCIQVGMIDLLLKSNYLKIYSQLAIVRKAFGSEVFITVIGVGWDGYNWFWPGREYCASFGWGGCRMAAEWWMSGCDDCWCCRSGRCDAAVIELLWEMR